MLTDESQLKYCKSVLDDKLSAINSEMSKLISPAEFEKLKIWKNALECATNYLTNNEEIRDGLQHNKQINWGFHAIKEYSDRRVLSNHGPQQRSGFSEVPTINERMVSTQFPSKLDSENSTRCYSRSYPENVEKYLANIALNLAEKGNHNDVICILKPLYLVTCQDIKPNKHKEIAQSIYAISLCRQGNFIEAKQITKTNSSQFGQLIHGFIILLENPQKSDENQFIHLVSKLKIT